MCLVCIARSECAARKLAIHCGAVQKRPGLVFTFVYGASVFWAGTAQQVTRPISPPGTPKTQVAGLARNSRDAHQLARSHARAVQLPLSHICLVATCIHASGLPPCHDLVTWYLRVRPGYAGIHGQRPDCRPTGTPPPLLGMHSSAELRAQLDLRRANI